MILLTACAPKAVAPQSAGPVEESRAASAEPPASVDVVRPAEPIVFALAGRTLVIPIVPDSPAAEGVHRWVPSHAPIVAFLTGEPLSSQTYWFRVQPKEGAAGWEWLPAIAEWRAWTLDEVVGAIGSEDPLGGPGFWAVAVETPPRAAGRELRLDGRPMPIRWLSDPPARTDAARAPHPRTSPSALRGLGRIIAGESRDPLLRWRVRLILDRWAAEDLWGRHEAGELEAPALEALASQNEWRWRAALASLAKAGPDTAADVLARLTAVVLMPDGSLLPAWPLDDGAPLRLRNDLLRAEADDDDRLNAAQAWLASLPPAVAWVIDDGDIISAANPSGADSERARRVRVGIAELTGKRARAAATAEGAPADDSRMVEEHETTVITAAAPVGSAAVRPLRVQVGRWSGRVLHYALPTPARPPGLALGPLLPQWRMPGWLAGVPGLCDPEWASAGLLSRTEAGDGWEVYIECRVAGDAGTSEGDAVRLHWGAPGLAEHVIELKAPAWGSFEGDRWSLRVALPEKAIDPDGTVRLALERVDARGARSSWPRPMLPGEAEPARAVIDLKGWGDLRAEP